MPLVFSGEVSVEALRPFLNRVVWFSLLRSFKRSLYVVGISPISDL